MDEPLWAVIVAVIIPIFLFMLALRPFIRDTALSAIRDTQNEVERLKGEWNQIQPSLEPLRELSLWAQKRGLEGILKGPTGQADQAHSSLPTERAARRDYLTQQGRARGLTDAEAAELQNLLEEDARDDFTHGLISFTAFVLIILGIAAIVRAASRR